MNDQLIDTNDLNFTIESHGVHLHCIRLDITGYVAYKIEFSSQRKPLIIARARGQEAPYFWTSIPEGRQKEAEGVGLLIEQYLLDKR